ncbi:MAG TPA: hypothetical protein VHT51_11420 [Micropepsaceae bacterium]|nr:hypothetical protein [Micropepsaceae bacterium]
MTKHVHMSPPRKEHAAAQPPWLFWLEFLVLLAGGAMLGYLTSSVG